jgi:hypothetical protein
MDQAKSWYKSTTVLALIAGMILQVGGKLGLLPPAVTNDQIVSFLAIVLPMAVALYGRLTATTVLTSSKTGGTLGIVFFFAVMLLPLTLSACAQPGLTSAGTVASAADAVELDAYKSLTLAEIGYQTIAGALLIGIQNGQITGAAAARVRTLNATATMALSNAYAATSAADRAAQVAILTAATLSLQSLKP